MLVVLIAWTWILHAAWAVHFSTPVDRTNATVFQTTDDSVKADHDVTVTAKPALAVFMIANRPMNPVRRRQWECYAFRHGYDFEFILQEGPWSWHAKWTVQLQQARLRYSPSPDAPQWLLMVDAGDTIVLDETQSLNGYLSDEYPVQLHWRENGEVTAAAVLVNLGHPRAEDFLARWLSRSMTLTNVDNGALLELILDALWSDGPMRDDEHHPCVALRQADYKAMIGCLMMSFSKASVAVAEKRLKRKGVRIYWPGEGFWRSLDCKQGFESISDRSLLLTGDVLGHGCKVGERFLNSSGKCPTLFPPLERVAPTLLPVLHRMPSNSSNGGAMAEEIEVLARHCLLRAHACHVEGPLPGRTAEQNLCEQRAQELHPPGYCVLPHMRGPALLHMGL